MKKNKLFLRILGLSAAVLIIVLFLIFLCQLFPAKDSPQKNKRWRIEVPANDWACITFEGERGKKFKWDQTFPIMLRKYGERDTFYLTKEKINLGLTPIGVCMKSMEKYPLYFYYYYEDLPEEEPSGIVEVAVEE
jgi:hypothetical protein